MPIYEYSCDLCKALVERLESFRSPDPPPLCCNTSMKRCISGAQVHLLKGAGFYATEFGVQAHYLEPTNQARRAARECKERHLVPARPQKHSQQEIDGLQQYERDRR